MHSWTSCGRETTAPPDACWSYLRACRAVALAVTGDEADADDVCQDAFVAAMARVHECREPARFGGWLLQIVRNRARNLARSPAVRRAVMLDEHAPSAGPSPVADVERQELRERLLAALAEIPERHREVVLLHDLEGWKHREIGERLGLPEGTVRWHLHHARRCRESVTQATLTLPPDSLWALEYTKREVCGDRTEDETEREDGRYSVTADTLHFHDDDGDDGRDDDRDDLDDLATAARAADGALIARLEDGRTTLVFRP